MEIVDAGLSLGCIPHPCTIGKKWKLTCSVIVGLKPRVGSRCLAVPDEAVWLYDDDIRGLFPDQFMSLEHLLAREAGFKKTKPPQTNAEETLEPQYIRYYHIPYTHMSVSTSPINSYF